MGEVNFRCRTAKSGDRLLIIIPKALTPAVRHGVTFDITLTPIEEAAHD